MTTASALRIAHLQLLPLLSGVQRVTLTELERLDRSRFEPWIICKEPGPLTEAAEQAGIACLYVPDLVRAIVPARDWAALRSLRALFRQHRFDVVHTHSSKTGILGRAAARMAGVPVVIHTVHGFAFPAAGSRLARIAYTAMEFAGARLMDGMITLNQDDGRLARSTLKVPPRKLFHIPNGVPLPALAADRDTRARALRAELGLDPDLALVAMVGRLWQQKNPMCLARAARRVLCGTGIPAQFVFVGDGELRAEVEALAREAGIDDRMKVLGWRDDVPRLLGAVDVFVLPSLWEGMPLAILEAMAAGVPPIVSDIPGSRDLVSHDEDGLLFKPDNDGQLAGHIARLVAAPALRRQLGEQARRKVERAYQLEPRVQQMQTLYLDLLAKRRRPRRPRELPVSRRPSA